MNGSRGRILLVNAPEKEGLAPPDGAALLRTLEDVSKQAITEYADVVGTDPLVPNPRYALEYRDPERFVRALTALFPTEKPAGQRGSPEG